MKIDFSDRLRSLPPYLFAELDGIKRKALAEGRDIIDLSVGDPDQPTPAHIVEALSKAAADPANQHYALDFGMDVLRTSIAHWYLKRFGVKLKAECQILPLLGAKEGIAHIPVGFVDPGDYCLYTEPCYPPYRGGTILAGGRPYPVPLVPEMGFLPDLDSIPKAIAKKARLFFLNFPNNPTAATAEKPFFKKVVKFAEKFGVIICHDATYSEVAFDGCKPPSFLEVDGAFEVGIEFHSLSKTYNMTGWRVGWACGNPDILAGLSKVKSNIDSGIFQPVQLAAVAALNGPKECLRKTVELYRQRRNCVVDGLNSLGWKLSRPVATFYIWARLPGKTKDSKKFAKKMLKDADILITPGIGFGSSGEGYVRMALTVPKERLEEAVARLRKL